MNEQEFVQRYLAEERDFSGIDFTDIRLDAYNTDLLNIIPAVSLNEEDSNPRIILKNLNLADANFENAEIIKINFENCNFYQAQLQNLLLSEVNFHNCNLEKANIEFYSLYKTSFENSSLI